jgi:hypothetical protein
LSKVEALAQVCHDIQQNDIQSNDTGKIDIQQNDIQSNDTVENDIEPNDTEQNSISAVSVKRH